MSKKKGQTVSRRSLLLGASATAAALPFSSSCAASRSADLSVPSDALDAYARLRGSTQTETVYQLYRGDVFLSLDGHVQAPLVGFHGIQKSNWYRDESHRFRSVDYDVGLYLDPDSREALDQWENPLTGKTVDVIHYRSGPAKRTHDLEKGEDGTLGDFSSGWRVTGDIVEHESGAWRERPNMLMPKDYPLGSSGERLYFSTSYTMMGRMSEIADAGLAKAPCSYVWTMLASWPPWMQMGQRPGFVMWRWIGHKVMSKDDIDPALIKAVENVWPGYIDAENPWEEVSSGWHQYQWMKEGHKPT